MAAVKNEIVGWTICSTALGPCGVAWTEKGVKFFHLPENSVDAAKSAMRKRTGIYQPTKPLPWVSQLIDKVQRHFLGNIQDFSEIPIDLGKIGEFYCKVFAAAREIPPGVVKSYGHIAKEINSPSAARAVGQALGKNPIGLIIPCHRVISSGRKLGGFSAFGGTNTKEKMLLIEGVCLQPIDAIDSPKKMQRAIKALRQADRQLARLIDKVGKIDFSPKVDEHPLEALLSAIVHQQLSPKAASTILGRVKALWKSDRPLDPHEILKTPDELLRKAGLSGMKVSFVKDLAQRTINGEVPSLQKLRAMPDEAIMSRLTVIKGVGRWTVEMFLIFNLGRSNILPVLDLGIRKGIERTFKLRKTPTSEEILKFGKKWQPYSSVASLYLWKMLDDKGSKKPQSKISGLS